MWSLPAALHLPGVALLRSRKAPFLRASASAAQVSRNLDNGPVMAGGASMLGVGHFTVPPDVVDEGLRDMPSSDVTGSLSPIRTIIVPHGIAAVPRRSPIKARKRTPWHPVPQADGVVERAGREWFTDRLFVESKQRHLPAACSTSAMVHAVVLALVLLFLAARAGGADLTPRRHTDVSLRMPAILSLPPALVASPPARTAGPPSPVPVPPQTPLSVPARETPLATPLDVPPSIEPEPTTLDAAASEGVVAAETGGVPGGNASGTSLEAAPPAPAAAVPLRVGEGVDRPRKIKDVKPIYPRPAMLAQVRGSVLIEATIGADGKVHNARVIRSIAALDEAALDAVRQWEFEPSRVDGVPVAVMMVIIVSFTLL